MIFPVLLVILDIFVSLKFIQMQNPNCLVMVDNCYGEFVESIEPPMVVCEIFCIPSVLIPLIKNKNVASVCRVQI